MSLGMEMTAKISPSAKLYLIVEILVLDFLPHSTLGSTSFYQPSHLGQESNKQTNVTTHIIIDFLYTR